MKLENGGLVIGTHLRTKSAFVKRWCAFNTRVQNMGRERMAASRASSPASVMPASSIAARISVAYAASAVVYAGGGPAR